MRVAVVAGPWPGHVFPAAGLARALADAADGLAAMAAGEAIGKIVLTP
jgi:UDP:flavonoid glycosyltransferase YjiC (YdhE family)